MPYNPADAPEREPLKFKATVKGTINEIMTMQEACAAGYNNGVIPDTADPAEPYWKIEYADLGAKLTTTGENLRVSSGCRLFSKNQEGGYRQADKTQRPAQIATAFAGHQISIFPGDPTGKFDAWCQSKGLEPIGANPDYDSTKFVGNCFIVEKPAPNRDNPNARENFAAPLPTAVLGNGYVFTGEVRLVTPKANQTNESGQAAPSPANFRDILQDEESRETVLKAIDGRKTDDLDQAIIDAGVSHNLQINGESVMGAAVAGKLAATLEAAGYIAIEDGTVTTISTAVPA